MNVLFINPEPLSNENSAREMELIENHKKKNDFIFYFNCKLGFYSCMANIEHHVKRCVDCMNFQDKIYDMSLKNYEKVKIVRFDIFKRKILADKIRNYDHFKKVINKLYKAKGINEIKQIRYKNCNIGYEAISTLITNLQFTELELNSSNFSILLNLMKSSMVTIEFLIEIFNKLSINLVYVPHGRRAPTRSILEKSIDSKIYCNVYEVGSNSEKYELYSNTLLHSFGLTEKRVMSFWDKSDEAICKKYRIGASFFRNKVKDRFSSLSFVKKQQSGELPNDWDGRKTNITFFLTSDDEFASISEEWDNKLYENQYVGLEKIFDDLNKFKNFKNLYHIYVRLHPNLINKKGIHPVTKKIQMLKYNFVTIILPKSDIDSYALLLNSNKVITFGSTMGIEAVYWKKPSILLAPSPYYNLNCTINPKSHNEVINNILKRAKIPGKNERILSVKYGYYRLKFGKPFNYVKLYEDKIIFKNKELTQELNFKYKLIKYWIEFILKIFSEERTNKLKNRIGV